MNEERVAYLLRDIEESLKVARKIASLPLSEFISDIRNKYTLRLALVEIVEAAVGLGMLLLRERGMAEGISGYTLVFRRMVDAGIISPSVGREMERLARLRNLIVHRYWEIDDVRIYTEANANGLAVIERFVREVKDYAGRPRA